MRHITHRGHNWATVFVYVTLALLLSAILVAPTRAQDVPAGPTPPASSDDTFAIHKGQPIRTETEMTLVGTSVTDPLGRLVTGLEQENFRVFEDGVEQEIIHFSSQDVPVS